MGHRHCFDPCQPELRLVRCTWLVCTLFQLLGVIGCQLRLGATEANGRVSLYRYTTTQCTM